MPEQVRSIGLRHGQEGSAAIWQRAFTVHGNADTELEESYAQVHSPDHVQTYVFLRMLAPFVEWHMRRRLTPTLLADNDRRDAPAQRNLPVEMVKANMKLSPKGLPVHKFRTLLDGLSGMTLNQLRLLGHGESPMSVVTAPTPLRKQALQLLGGKPDQNVPKRLQG